MEREYAVNNIVVAWCEEYGKEMEAIIQDIKNSSAYIHFIKQDKRLDTWVSFNELKDSSFLSSYDKDDRFLTRNQRKFFEDDEINDLPPEVRPFEKAHQEVTKIRNIDQCNK